MMFASSEISYSLPKYVFQEQSSHIRLIFNLGSTIIIHSNSSSILFIGFTGSLLLIWDFSSPNPFSAVILTGFS